MVRSSSGVTLQTLASLEYDGFLVPT